MRSRRSNYYKVSIIGGLVILVVIIILIAGASLFTKYSPLEQNVSERLQTPSVTHVIGTDRFGRDIFSRTLYGGRTTLLAAMAALGITLTAGIVIGIIAGMFYGTIIDIVIMRIFDVFMAFPTMVFAMVVASLFGSSFTHLLIAIVSVYWVPFAKIARSITLQSKKDISMEAAIVLGATMPVIMRREIFPKVIGPVIVLATLELGNLILSISALSFLGLGAQPPTPEWGSMLSEARAHFLVAPHILIGPAMGIILTVLALNLLGEGVRDWLDPYEISSL